MFVSEFKKLNIFEIDRSKLISYEIKASFKNKRDTIEKKIQTSINEISRQEDKISRNSDLYLIYHGLGNPTP